MTLAVSLRLAFSNRDVSSVATAGRTLSCELSEQDTE
jgi:hypothetical protein